MAKLLHIGYAIKEVGIHASIETCNCASLIANMLAIKLLAKNAQVRIEALGQIDEDSHDKTSTRHVKKIRRRQKPTGIVLNRKKDGVGERKGTLT